MSEFQEKSGDDGVGSGSFHKGHNKKADDNDINHVDDLEKKSCIELVSDQSSAIGSGLLHKAHSKSEDDDDLTDVEDSEKNQVSHQSLTHHLR